MSIRDLSLKELRVLAQQQLGARAAGLKTRQELVEGVEAEVARTQRPPPKPRTPPLMPAPIPPPLRELPPAPLIWTGHAEPPKITAPVSAPAQSVAISGGRDVAPPLAPVLEPLMKSGACDPSGPTARPLQPAGPIGPEGPPKPPAVIRAPVMVTQGFFEERSEAEPLPAWYGDDRVLSFERDPGTVYAAWDFSAQTFASGGAFGQVLGARGAIVKTFSVERAAGGTFLSELPARLPLRIEVHGGAGLLGATGWWVLAGEVPSEPVAPSSSAK